MQILMFSHISIYKHVIDSYIDSYIFYCIHITIPPTL